MVEIRLAVQADAQVLLALGKRMRAEGPNFMKLDFSDEKAALVISRLIDNESLLVACKGEYIVGLLAFVVIEHLWGRDKIASDVAIFVESAHRGCSAFLRLIRTFETIAAERGVKMLELGVSAGIDNDKTAKMFSALGYHYHGIGMRKEVNHVQRV